MASRNRIDTALDYFVDKKLRDVHTSLRAVVLEVDYGVPSATVRPLAETDFVDGTVDRINAVFDVPLQMVSANGGKARLTVPIKPGDIVGLTFSERNENDNSDEQTHGLFAGWAITSVHSDGNAMPIDPENVELWNDQVHFTMTPSGDFTLTTPNGTLKVDSAGEFTFTNGAATMVAQTSGNVVVNGAKITPEGRMITAAGVDLDDFYAEYKRHTHNCPHGGNTSTPS